MDFLKPFWVSKTSEQPVHKPVAKGLRIDNSSKLTSAGLPIYPIWYYQTLHGVPRSQNLIETRQFARSVWVKMIHSAIKRAVTQTKWDIVVESEDPDVNEDEFKEDIAYARYLLNNPNRDRRSNFTRIVWEMLTDVLEINTGVWFLNGDMNGTLEEIIPYDGSTFLVQQDQAGFIEKFWQYTYRHPLTDPKPFDPFQVAWFQMEKSTYDPYGLSPLQTIEMIVELMTQSTRFNKDFFLNDAIPALLLNAVGAGSQGTQDLLDEWNEQAQGENSRLMAVDYAKLELHKLHTGNREMEWLDGQKWYMHTCFAVHGISPTEVGFTDTTGSKNVQEGQQQITIKNAHKPYLHMIEEEINSVILPWILGEFKVSPLKRKPLKFKFFVEDPEMARAEEEGQRADIISKIKSINEVRKERGLEPLDDPQADNPFYVNPDLLMGGDTFGNDEESKGKDDEASKDRSGKESGKDGGSTGRGDNKKSTSDNQDFGYLLKNVKPLDNLEYTKNYEEFFDVLLKSWEEAVLEGLNKRLHKNMSSSSFQKGFNDFLSVVIGKMTTAPFLNIMKTVVKKTLLEGQDQAEQELDMNVTLGRKFATVVESEALRQFDGYTLTTGEKWPGISGLARKAQNKVLSYVSDGVQKGLDNAEMEQGLKDLFKNLANTQIKSIVRTESNRMINSGKIETYKASGVKGKKEYVAFDDNRTTDVCKSLNGQVVGLDESFVDYEGRKYSSAPAHINCRSFVRFVPGE